jgi:hypothetical protein
MSVKTRVTMILLICFTSGFRTYGFQGGGSEAEVEKVYYGEVVEKSSEAITLNVTPCENKKSLQRVSPYEVVGSQETSCSGGKSYVRVAVQAREGKPIKPGPKPPSNPDTDKDKKQPQTPPDKKGDKPADHPPSDSPNQAVNNLRGSENEA